jgi:hypothetical protein
MTFRQERLIFDGGRASMGGQLLVDNGCMADYEVKAFVEHGYTVMTEDEYLTSIAAEGWRLHTANYCVLGKQECHYFLFVKE